MWFNRAVLLVPVMAAFCTMLDSRIFTVDAAGEGS